MVEQFVGVHRTESQGRNGAVFPSWRYRIAARCSAAVHSNKLLRKSFAVMAGRPARSIGQHVKESLDLGSYSLPWITTRMSYRGAAIPFPAAPRFLIQIND